jgi:DNA-binding MarR family transcriptional regulator
MTSLDDLATRYNSLGVHLSRRLRLTDRETGIGPARLSALSVLVFGGPRTISELAQAEGVTLPTISRIVQGLEAGGLAERTPHASDRRSVTVAATPRGCEVMERARRRRVEQLAHRLSALPAEELAKLEAAVGALEALERVAD